MEIVIVWILFGIVTWVAASSRGRSGCGWGLMGLLLGPFGLILVLVLPKVDKTFEGVKFIYEDKTKKCPYCAEEIKEEAIKCRYCGSDLGTSPDQPSEEG